MNTKTKYKALKVAEIDYQILRRSQEELAKRGIRSLPKDFVSSEKCPVCGSHMEGVKVELGYVRCISPDCGYQRKSLKVDATGAFALGALIGLGAAALVYLATIESKNKKRKR